MVRVPKGSSFNRLIFRAAVLPIALLLMLAGVLVWQIHYLLGTVAWVEHTDLVIANAHQLLRLHVDMETGLRGYLITKNQEFLEPFNRGRVQIPPLSEETRQLVA